ncbi:MAG TPA: dehypoxanthine futalosine cyclase, partial [Syntrophomonas sp.]|nr:dehypoxanthine futalosine cyclase [Syntrophomonas sp.]
GSIMIEENVVRSAGLVYKMDKKEMINLIADAGRVPALRDTEYRLLDVYNSNND